MRIFTLLLAVAVTGLAALGSAQAAPKCDRACLYGVLDQYLAALAAKEPSKAPLASNVRNTENNVALKVGDGVWGTITSLGSYDFRFADPATGGVGFYGVLTEYKTAAPFALRLEVKGGRIAEIETVITRPQDAGIPFVTADIAAKPVLEEMLAPSERTPRKRMIELANGYFDTLQQNDGRLHTEFDPACNRRENGFQTTNHPDSGYGPSMALGCADQFRMGYFRYDDRLRSRRYEVVDEERGLVMAAAFIDHAGVVGDYKLSDGTPATASYRRPHSYSMLETFKIKAGKIEQVEAVFTTVPYRMPSPWTNEKWVKGGFEYE
jgi:hypothetical protein